MEWLLVAVPAIALVALFAPGRYSIKPLFPSTRTPPPDDPDGSGVREPRRPSPHGGAHAVAIDPRRADNP